jgi:hypothetical protein
MSSRPATPPDRSHPALLAEEVHLSPSQLVRALDAMSSGVSGARRFPELDGTAGNCPVPIVGPPDQQDLACLVRHDHVDRRHKAGGRRRRGIVVKVDPSPTHGPVGALVSAWPALVLVGSFELLMTPVRTGRSARSDHAVPELRYQAVPPLAQDAPMELWILPGQFLGSSQFMCCDKQAHDQVHRSNNRQAASVNGNRRRFQLRVGKTWMAVRGWAEVPERRLATVKLCL